VGTSKGAWGGSRVAIEAVRPVGPSLRVDGRLSRLQGDVLGAIQYRLNYHQELIVDYKWLCKRVGYGRTQCQQAVRWLSTNGYIATKQTHAHGHRAIAVVDAERAFLKSVSSLQTSEKATSVKTSEKARRYEYDTSRSSEYRGGEDPDKTVNRSAAAGPAALSTSLPTGQDRLFFPTTPAEVLGQLSASLLDEGQDFVRRALACVLYYDPLEGDSLESTRAELVFRGFDLSSAKEQAWLTRLTSQCQRACLARRESNGRVARTVDLLQAVLASVFESAGALNVGYADARAPGWRSIVYRTVLHHHRGQLSLYPLVELKGGRALVAATIEAILATAALDVGGALPLSESQEVEVTACRQVAADYRRHNP